MNSTLSLGRPGPAPRARVAARGWTRTWHTADARVALVEQRVVGHIVREDIRPDFAFAPKGQRVDLQQRVPRAPLHQLGRRAGSRLVTADAADPGVVGRQRLGQRGDLANGAAAVGIALVKPLALLASLLVERERRVAA